MSPPQLQSHIKQTYRAILRELPRFSLSTPTTLHTRIREAYRSPTQPTQTGTNKSSSHPASSNGKTEISEEETLRRLQEAEQFAQYAKAQRTYVQLVDRYNPGSWLDEEERVRLTARRVGMDLPEEYKEEKKVKNEEE